jgi:DNA (cytosine-5)-methyltransferase 1
VRSLCGAGKREGGPEVRYLSVCSGIEAATVAWHDMGWQPAAFSEIEPFPSAVLAHHYPTVPNVGDMTKYKEWDIGAIDLLVGGTPCQSFSVAGLRKGLADPRGNLALVYLGIADLFKPKWIVWENVPGVLSSGGGRDFGSFLGALAQLGYGFAYRVLDAQWFGVAQRRRRVFVVGYLGDWRPAAAVLFERQSLSGHPKPSREAGQRVAPTVVQGPPYSRTGNERVECEAIVVGALTAKGPEAMGAPEVDGQHYIPMLQPIPYDLHQVTAPVNRQAREPGDPCHTLAKQNAHNAGIVSIQGNLIGREAGGPFGVGASDEGVMYTLTKADVHGVAQPIGGVDYENNAHLMNQPTGPLLRGSSTGGGRPLPALVYPMAVRRLTPVECERLQGFPDNYTEIPWRGKAETPDGPRYKALGNSMAVPVMRWIGQRIQGR